ncbi:MAG: glycosyltransferase [Lentisphaeria bacterium]
MPDPINPKLQFSGPRGFPQASTTFAGWQKMCALTALALLTAGVIVKGYFTLLLLNAFFMTFYIVSSIYRAILIDISLRRNRDMVIEPHELVPPDGEWPRYLVIVPLYHESAILPHLIDALRQIDYPRDKLEIRLLIEEDDEETKEAARLLNPRPPFVHFPVPVSEPRTKPKACNAALEDADADYLVIFDAEDRPDPDQLKKAAVAFSRVNEKVVCIQAKLNFYNPHQNFLTKCFTSEYATWFDLCLPGLDFLRAPIPLGGTSNHFRLDILKQMGGWDEYNVTEDCDLGLRLFHNGWRTQILDSTTWEQACPKLGNWIRQRSRWVKGYLQTYFVHLRDPVKTTLGLGIFNNIHYHLLIGGTAFTQLINPVYWFLALLWLCTRSSAFSAFFPGPIFVMAALCLFVGNFLFAYTSSIACVRRGRGEIAIYGMLMPIYWIFMSAAAWKGFIQLLRNPHYWEKTQHFENE